MTQNLQDIYEVKQYIDTFALGHYARVLGAKDLRSNQNVAFKVMRPEHLVADGDMRWEYRAFGNEAQILNKLKPSPHVVQLLDCGFVSTVAEAAVDGKIDAFGTNVDHFVDALPQFARRGWRPYLTLEYLPRMDNMFYLMKPTQPGMRRRLPSEEGITLALQFANLLALSHQVGVVYLDHKLEHVYWDGNNLRVIDFNSSRQLGGTTSDSMEYVKDIHNLCVGILYPLFTGMSPHKSSLRPSPGGMDVVENRYADVSKLDFMMEPTLSNALKQLLQRGAAGRFSTVTEFIASLRDVAALHGRDFPEQYTSIASRQARDKLREGLRKLREGEAKIREARDFFREAAILDDITEDLEDELRRLVKSTNELLNHRVVP